MSRCSFLMPLNEIGVEWNNHGCQQPLQRTSSNMLMSSFGSAVSKHARVYHGSSIICRVGVGVGELDRVEGAGPSRNLSSTKMAV